MSNLLVPAEAVESVTVRYTRLKEAFVALVAIPLVSGEEPPQIRFGGSNTEEAYNDSDIFVVPSAAAESAASPAQRAVLSARLVQIAAQSIHKAIAALTVNGPFKQFDTIRQLPFVLNAVRYQFNILIRNITVALRLVLALPEGTSWAVRVQALRYELAPILDVVQAQTAPKFADMADFLATPRPVFSRAEAQAPGDPDAILRDVIRPDLNQTVLAQVLYAAVDMATAGPETALLSASKAWLTFEAKATFRQLLGLTTLRAGQAAFALEDVLVVYNLWALAKIFVDQTLYTDAPVIDDKTFVDAPNAPGDWFGARLYRLYTASATTTTNLRAAVTDEFVLKVTRPAVFLLLSRQTKLAAPAVIAENSAVWQTGLTHLYRTARYVMEHLAKYLGRSPATAALVHLALAAAAARATVERAFPDTDARNPLIAVPVPDTDARDPPIAVPVLFPNTDTGVLRTVAETVLGFRRPADVPRNIGLATVGDTLVDTLANLAHYGPGPPFVKILVPLVRLILMPFRRDGLPDDAEDPGERVGQRRELLERFLREREEADTLLRQRVQAALEGQAAPELVAENRRLRELVDAAASCRANEDEVRAARAELEAERRRHTEEIAALRQSLEVLRLESSEGALQQRAELLDRLLDATDTEEGLRERIAELETNLDELAAAKADADAELETLARSRAELERQIETVRARADEAAARADQAEASASEAAEARTEAETRADTLEQELATARAEGRELQEQAENLLEQVAALENDIAGGSGGTAEVVNAMNEILRERDASIARLRAELENTRAELAALEEAYQDEVARMRPRLEELEAARDALRERVETLAAQAADAGTERALEDAQTKLEKTEAEAKTLRDALARVQEETRGLRQQQREALDRMQKELRTQTEEAARQLAEKDARIDELEDEVAENARLVEEIRAGASTSEAELARRRTEAEAAAAATRAELDAAREKLAAAEDRAGKTEAALRAAQDAVDAAAARVARSDQELSDARARLADAEFTGEQLEAARAERDAAQAALETARRELETLQSQAAESRKKLEECGAAHQALEEQLAGVRTELAEARSNLERERARSNELAEDLARREQHIATSKARIGDYQKRIRKLKDELAETKRRAEAEAEEAARLARQKIQQLEEAAAARGGPSDEQAAELAEAKAKVETEQARVRAARAREAELRETLGATEAELAKAVAAQAAAEERLPELRRVVERADARLSEALEREQRLLRANEEVRRELEKVRNELAEVVAPGRELEQFREEVELLRRRDAAQEEVVVALQDAVKEQADLNNTLRNELKTAQRSVAKAGENARQAGKRARAEIARLEQQVAAANQRNLDNLAAFSDELAQARMAARARADEAEERLRAVNESLATLRTYICARNTTRQETDERLAELNATVTALRAYICARGGPVIGAGLLDHPAVHIGRFYVEQDGRWVIDWFRWRTALRAAVEAFNTYVVGTTSTPTIDDAVAAFDRALRAHFVLGKPRALAAALARLRRAVRESDTPPPASALARFALLSNVCPV